MMEQHFLEGHIPYVNITLISISKPRILGLENFKLKKNNILKSTYPKSSQVWQSYFAYIL